MSERVRKLRVARSGNSGYSTISRDSEAIMSEAVENFYAVARVRELADKWENATELSSGAPSVVARAFAAELKAAIASDVGRRFHGAEGIEKP